MNEEQRLMIKGMDALLRRFVMCPDDKEFTVREIIKASNEVYEAILNSELN